METVSSAPAVDTSANVTPDTSADSGQDSGNQEGASPREGQSLKQQIRELGDSDMDALVTVKVNGKVEKMALKEAIKLSQLEKASHAKMQEAASLKKQVQEFAKFVKANPRAAMQQMGIDPYEFAEATLAEKLEMMQMSPEQKKLREYEERLKKYDEQEKLTKAQAEKQRQEQEEHATAQSLDQEITEAFTQSGLPKDPYYVQLMAAEMLSAEKRGQSLTARDAAAKVKLRFSSGVNSVLGSMDAQAILELLSPDVVKKIREAELKRVTSKAPPTIDSAGPVKTGSSEGTKTKPKQPLNEREFREWLRNR